MAFSIDSEDTATMLAKVAAGSPTALERLLEVHRPFLKRVIEMRMEPALRSRLDASDVAQEAQIMISKGIGQFVRQRPTSFRIWIRRKALDQLKDERRRHIGAMKRSVLVEQNISDVSSIEIARKLLSNSPSKILNQIELRERVYAVFSRSKSEIKKPSDRSLERLDGGPSSTASGREGAEEVFTSADSRRNQRLGKRHRLQPDGSTLIANAAFRAEGPAVCPAQAEGLGNGPFDWIQRAEGPAVCQSIRSKSYSLRGVPPRILRWMGARMGPTNHRRVDAVIANGRAFGPHAAIHNPSSQPCRLG